ncbi:MAG: M61 family metallopeptidase [Pyrinomonadaceae bacterium]
MRPETSFLAVCLSLALVAVAAAQTLPPARTAHLYSAPPAAPIELALDATDAPRRVLHARMTIPAAPGPLTLYYPAWIPGEHGPTGPITDLVNVKFTAGRQTLEWQRDQADMFTFHLNVPPGVRSIEATLDFLLTTNTEGFSAGASASAQLVVINWNQVLLYPSDRPAADITFAPSIKLPAGWKFGTALDVAREARGEIEFAPVALVTLIDSPLSAGAYYRVLPLGNTPVHHEIDMAADSAAALDVSPRIANGLKQLVAEAQTLFGAHHYRHYNFLFTLSDQVASFGLEHHESSDDRVAERTLLDEQGWKLAAGLLPHEFVHSWNGKYRRPAGLVNADYQKPMRTELLWVYEGLTEYLGVILTARSGLWSEQDTRENLAWIAAYLDKRGGRGWRPLSDTATAAQLLYNAPAAWANTRRSVDFYDEGTLIWLDADARIRQQTNGQKSLDDFCHLFHGPPSGPPEVKTYEFEDVVRTLNEVAPGDWAGFLNTRVRAVAPRAPLGGLETSGWRLVYNDTPNEYMTAADAVHKSTDLSFSLGLLLRADGTISDILPEAPGEAAGLSPGMKIIAVNGRRFSTDGLHDAIRAAKTDRAPIELLIENAEYYRTYKLNYHGGESYPHLERIAGRPDPLSQILKSHAPHVAAATER